VSKFRGKLFEDDDLKRRKIGEIGPERQHHVPRAWQKHTMRLEHGLCYTPMRLEQPKCAERKRLFLLFMGKARVFSPTRLKTLTINTNILHS